VLQRDHQMKNFAVIGNPVAHSKSPIMFNYFFKKKEVNAHYTRITAHSFIDAIKTCELLSMSGINITMPFKKDACKFVDEMDNAAGSIHAVNTIVFDSRIKGYNTDVFGALNPLKKRFKTLKGRKILIVGAGGAANAAIYSFSNTKATCYITNRTADNGLSIAKKFNAIFYPFKRLDRILPEMDAVVYTIPVKINLDISLMNKGTLFFSAIYRDKFFKSECKKHGIHYISGEEWLIEQGVESCKRFGYECNIEQLRRGLTSTRKKTSISLIGFMGSGKTTIGKALASELSLNFIDLDMLIEEKEGCSIHSIFEKRGERYFRNLELHYLKTLLNKKGFLIATGGGIVTYKHSFNILKENFFNVFLYGDISDLYNRTLHSKRPLRKDYESFLNLFEKRKNIYIELSDLILNTSIYSIENAVRLLRSELSHLL